MKKRSILDSVEVKSPCSQDWNLMFGNDEVRFCEHCVKHVHDLSAMTRREAEKFAARSNGAVCVRYTRRPDGKMQTAGDKLYRITSRASRLAAGVFGASLTIASSAYAQDSPVSTASGQEKTAAAAVRDQNKQSPGDKGVGSISGTVTDQNEAVIPGVEVILTDRKTQAARAVSSDENGGYLFSDVEEGNYDLEFKAKWFNGRKINNINFNHPVEAKYDAALSAGAMTGELVIAPEYENQLVRAVQEINSERVERLITQGINVNEKDNNGGVTALHIAVQKADLKIVTFLLQLGAKPNIRDERGRTALMQIGEDYNAEDFDNDESEENDESDIKETEETREAKAVKLNTDIFNLLIAHGAKVNLRDSEGFTALMSAARSENPELLRLLISHKANIGSQAKNGRTALMEAADEDELENVKILLEAGADVNLKDDDGDTAMSLAGDREIKQLLLSYGAKPEEPGDN
jgi:hypothetical protein